MSDSARRLRARSLARRPSLLLNYRAEAQFPPSIAPSLARSLASRRPTPNGTRLVHYINLYYTLVCLPSSGLDWTTENTDRTTKSPGTRTRSMHVAAAAAAATTVIVAAAEDVIVALLSQVPSDLQTTLPVCLPLLPVCLPLYESSLHAARIVDISPIVST